MANEAHKRLMRAFDDAVESLVGELGEESAEFKDKRQQARGNIAKNKDIVEGAEERVGFLENALEEWQAFLDEAGTPTPKEYNDTWRRIFGETPGFVKGTKSKEWWDDPDNTGVGASHDPQAAGEFFRNKVTDMGEQVSAKQPEKIARAQEQIVIAEDVIVSLNEGIGEARGPERERREAALALGGDPSEEEIIGWMLDSGFNSELDEVVATDRRRAETALDEAAMDMDTSFEGRLPLIDLIADVREERGATEDLAKERFKDRPGTGVEESTPAFKEYQRFPVEPGVEGGAQVLPPEGPLPVEIAEDPMQIGLEEGLAAQTERQAQARVTDPLQAVPEFGMPAPTPSGGDGPEDPDLTSRLGDVGAAFDIAEQFGYRFFLYEPGTETERQDMMMEDPDNPGTDINVLIYITKKNLTNTAEIQEAFKQTEWFNNTTVAMQNFDLSWDAAGPFDEWDNLTPRREELIKTEKDYILDQLELLGITDKVDEAKVNELAAFVKRSDMDNGAIRDYLSDVESGVDFQSYIADAEEGLLATYKQSLETTAAQYMVGIDDDDMDVFVEGLYDADDPAAQLSLFKNHFRQQAKERFPTLSGVIDQGITPQQYFAPYKQRVSALLERPVDFMGKGDSGLFDQIAMGMPDDKFGQRTMTFTEMNKYVRGLDEWQYTKNANDEARQVADNVGRMFGFVA